MPMQDAVQFCAAGRSIGMKSHFTDKVTGMGAEQRHLSNCERDFLRFAKKDLEGNFELYHVKTVIRNPGTATKSAEVGVLLPHEVCHWLWHHNEEKFHILFVRARIIRFWALTIEANEEWWQRHPLRMVITNASDRARFLPLQLFGDDGCLKKSRVYRTLTWFPATHTSLETMESRIPTYCLPSHSAILDVTDVDVQEAVVWSFCSWLTGRMPQTNHLQESFEKGTTRYMMGQQRQCIAGGHTGVYVGTLADQLWMLQHYRFNQSWMKTDCCNQCFAQNASGFLDFSQSIDFPARDHGDYMASGGARISALTRIPGFHLSLCRGEGMHAGPLGSMPDAVASALVELADEGRFGCSDIGRWDDRLQAQLHTAFPIFADWAKSQHESHTIKKFSLAGLSMTAKHTSFPCYKGKAHNCLVLCRWLEFMTAASKHESEYCLLRWQAIWAWVEIFDVCMKSVDRDFLNPSELSRLDSATTILLHGCKHLASLNALSGKARWKTRPKLHIFYHINKDAQASGRNPRSWMTFRDEEFMGKMASIASAVHGLTMCNRSLQRWCLHFFSAMELE